MNRNVFRKILLAGTFFLAIFFAFSLSARAATISFSPSAGKYSVGDTIPVQVIISSSDQSANAVSGTVIFPADKLNVTSLSESSSVINFWATQPSFSNTGGTVHFEGVILSPGFTGARGLILTAYFKVKTAGSASLTLSATSVLANDGSGTDITKPSGKANFTLANVAPAPTPLPAPTPAPITTKKTTSTSLFSVSEIARSDTTDPVINLIFNSQSATPVNHYTVVVDDIAGVDVINPNYTTAPLLPGSHNILVKVVYVGGSSLAATTDVVVTPIPTPIIKYYSNTVHEDSYLSVQGTSLAGTTVEAFLKDQYGTVITQKVIADGQGSFNIIWPTKLFAGVYKLTLQAIDTRGAQSLVSNESSVLVEPTPLVTWGLGLINYAAILALFVILLSGFAFWGVYLWHKLKGFRKNLEKNISQVDVNLHESFTLLSKDVKEHLDSIERARGERDLTDEGRRFIKKMDNDLKDAETSLENRIKDIDK